LALILDISEIQLILARHSAKLGRCVWPVWNRYIDGIEEIDRLAYDPIAEATVLNRYMVDFAKQEFSGVPGVQFFEENGFVLGVDGFQYGLPGQLACRFKKLDGGGKSKNNMGTRRARALRENETDDLDNVPPEATWVDIGYVFNGLHTGFSEVQVIRLVDTKFVMSIPREEDGTVIMPLPLNPEGGSGNRTRFTITPRREGSPDGVVE
jgi:hypothetical protein